MNIESEDKEYILKNVKEGEVVLILGAGASASSINSSGQPVKMASALAKTLAEKASLPYDSETLTEVVSAVRGIYISDVQIRDILIKEYKGVKPSEKLTDLFRVCWKRVYTFNYDDSVENINRATSQVRRYFNGMIDAAAEFEGPKYLHVVHMHGDINKPEHGFILSEDEYSRHAKSGNSFWYERCGQDYLSGCPIFIGTTINEPILLSEIERAKRYGELASGRGYVITPDSLSPIKIAALKSKGLIHIKGTLDEFSDWIKSEIPGGSEPRDVVAKANSFPEEALKTISSSDINVAHFLHPISPKVLAQKIARLTQTELSTLGRHFLRGFAPTWLLAGTDIPVRLEAYEELSRSLELSLDRGARLFVVSGQAGSGKTTATMMSILEYVRKHPEVPLYELSRDIPSVTQAFSLLQRLHSGKCIVFVGDLFIYGDGFSESIMSIKGNSLCIVSSVRTGEWNEHLSRYLSEYAEPFAFQRFVRRDYDPLIDRLIKYVPAPRFRKMTRMEQHKELSKSKSQLLIALREATDSENFDDIITNEFQKLPDRDTRILLLIVGLSTLSRTGINVSVAKEAYSKIQPNRSFEKALEALDGIVSSSERGRLFARHDIYIRHIFDDVAEFKEIHLAIKSILYTYIKYSMPIVRNVSRQDAQLFRFILNHSFVSEVTIRESGRDDGSVIYQDFETYFQLDGHYWLQYGLYLAGLGKLPEAIGMMQRSISAYAGNPYAVHALADLQLRSAKQRGSYDAVTRELIDGAVKTLRVMDTQQSLKIDQYPIVTLSLGHIGALVKHHQDPEAKKVAREYYERVKFLSRNVHSPMLDRAQERLFRFVTLGEWGDTQNLKRQHTNPRTKKKINGPS